MNSVSSFLLTIFVAIGISVAAAAPPNFKAVFNSFSMGVNERDAARVRLLSMSPEDLKRFLAEAKLRLDAGKRDDVIRAFDIVRRRTDFDLTLALKLKELLKLPESSNGPGAKSVLEERLHLVLDAKTGALTTLKIEDEFKFSANADASSTMRLARITALTDAMQSASMKPSASQLEALLQNDVFEIRMHAVDWFRLMPPASVDERRRFLRAALASSLVQVRERAFRTIASWSVDDVRALKKSGDVLPEKCAADTSAVIRAACTEIRAKAGAP